MNNSSIRTKTKFSLYIIESLRFEDEARRREGKILKDILRLADHRVHYVYIRTKRELEEVLYKFQDSESRYLHLSSHGNEENIELTLDRVTWRAIKVPCSCSARKAICGEDIVELQWA